VLGTQAPRGMLLREGWLFKEGGSIKSWKKRYFELVDTGNLSYFEKKVGSLFCSYFFAHIFFVRYSLTRFRLVRFQESGYDLDLTCVLRVPFFSFDFYNFVFARG
jgi:hypothetical protein